MIGRDPGLQPERTSLAWARTAMAIVVNAALVLRAGLIGDLQALAITGVLLLGCAATIAAYARHRTSELSAAVHGVASPWFMLIVSAASVLAALCGAIGVVLIPTTG